MPLLCETLERRRLLATITTVDSDGDLGQYTSIALNPRTGLPAIAYYNVTNGDLKFAAFNGTSWSAVTVDSAGDTGRHTSLKFDARGVPHIAYYDVTNRDLRYATRPGSSWQRRTVDSTDDSGAFSSLALTRNTGLARIAYHRIIGGVAGSLRFASFDGSSWSTEPIETDLEAPGVGGESALALDSQDRPHISFNNEGVLKYAHFDGAEWQRETLVSGVDDYGHGGSIVIYARDRPHIAYNNLPIRPSATIYTFKDERGWQSRLIDPSPATFDSSGKTSIAFDSRGLARISYLDRSGDARGLGIGEYDGHVISIEAPDPLGAGFASLAIGAGDVLHVAYYGEDNNLNYYRSDPDTGPPPVKSFDRATYNHIAIAADGTHHVAFYQPSVSTLENGQLWYASRSPDGTWSDSELVDAEEGDAGQFVSISLDSTGTPALAYYDATNADLKFAKRTGGSWQIETIDARGTVGQYPSLAFDSSNQPIASYYYKTSGDLRLAHFKNARWSIQTVDAAGDVGRSGDMVFDPANRVWTIAYEQTTDGLLKFARGMRGGGWQIATIDDTQTGGGCISLAYDSQHRPAISYFDSYNADLKFARFEGGIWRCDVVASRKSQGGYSQLFFDPGSDAAHVLYLHRIPFEPLSPLGTRHLDHAAGQIGAWTLSELRSPGGQNIRTARDPSSGILFFTWNDTSDVLVVDRLS
jgi:hypothetical protein